MNQHSNGKRRIVRAIQSFMGGVDMWLWEYDFGTRKAAMGRSIEMEPHDEGAPLGEPTFRLDGEGAQELMEQLWNAGVRPRDIGTAGHLQATQAHLRDMQAIAAKKLGVELGQSGGRAQPPRGGMFG